MPNRVEVKIPVLVNVQSSLGGLVDGIGSQSEKGLGKLLGSQIIVKSEVEVGRGIGRESAIESDIEGSYAGGYLSRWQPKRSYESIGGYKYWIKLILLVIYFLFFMNYYTFSNILLLKLFF